MLAKLAFAKYTSINAVRSISFGTIENLKKRPLGGGVLITIYSQFGLPIGRPHPRTKNASLKTLPLGTVQQQ